MDDAELTRDELLAELKAMRCRIAELEAEQGGGHELDEALRQREEKYRALFDENPIEIMIVDNQARVVGYNKAKERSGGRLPKVGDLMYRDYAAGHDIAMHDELLECIGKGKIKDFPEQRYGDRYLHIRMAPFPGGAIITSIDITKRKNFEHALQDSNRKFKELSELLPQIVYETDNSGKLIFVNHYAYEATGYDEEDLQQGLNALEMIVPEDRERAGKNFQRVLNGEILKGNEYLLLRKDGGRFPVIVYSTAVVSEGRPVGLRGMIIDIADRKKQEEEFRRAHKLESLGVLAGGIAHDFNNLLTAILGNISLAKIYVKPGTPISETLNDAEAAALRTKGLTRQLLTFSKGGEPVKEVAAIGELVKQASGFALLGSNVRCDYEPANNLWAVDVDTGQVKQAFQNIIINAAQAMPKGGIITIRAENILITEDHNLPLEQGRYVRISFADRGAGIMKKHLAQVFDPYFTTKDKGSGLGLSIAYSVIKNHGGFITAESWPGKGATFVVYIPAQAEEALQSEAVAGERVCTGRILVMDDEDFVRKVAGKMLKHLGCEAVMAVDGDEAIRLYKEAALEGRPFAVVIMDLTIPGGMGGGEAIKRLLEFDPEVRAVVSSGYANDPIMADFRKYGFKGVVPKPYKIETMQAALLDVMNG